ncbi:MAG: putative sulfate/molybdate transporter [Alphaproteobacteria bacterium]
MFDRLSKPGGDPGDSPAARPWLGDLSGAFADLGTFLPLVIGLLVLGRFDPTGLLIGFGLFAVATGLIYRLPVPVQPMKLVAALAIAGGLSAPAMMASGILLGVALLILGVSGAIERMHRLIPRTVLAGLQIALGLHLLTASARLASAFWGLGMVAAALLFLLLATPLRSISCILLVLAGMAWTLATGAATLPAIDPAWHLPTIGLPGWDAFHEAAVTVFWPQLALTVTNAVLLTSVLAADYFPNARPGADAKRLALSSGMLNLTLAPFGAMPMCHGSGGLVAQYHQGARSGLAPVIFGAVCLALGVLAGPIAVDLLLLVPLPVVAVLLGYAGIHLLASRQVMQATWTCRAVIALTALVSFGVNLAAGLAAGILLELARSLVSRQRQTMVR